MAALEFLLNARRIGELDMAKAALACVISTIVPHVMADVSIPPEENIDDVYCTIVDSSALPGHRGQLVANLKNAGSIVLMYDVERMETLARLNSVWLPLIETHTKDVPVVIVRNKVDKLADDPELGGRSDEELRRQMAPLRERYRFFHTSLECSSITQHGLSQVFHHALSAALYPIAPLYDTKAKELRPKFERAVRRLFRIYDRDRDALLADAELNNFQYRSFNLLLSEMDIVALKKILTRVAERTERNVAPEALVVPSSEQSEGGITVEGFLALMTLFIEKNQMKAPWKTLHAHDYDDSVKLLLPRTVLESSSASSSMAMAGVRAPAHGSVGSGGFFSLGRQILSPEAEAFLVSLFKQFAFVAEASSTPLLTAEGQAEVFSVIPDPACAPWDEPRSASEFGWRLDSYSDRGLFGRLRRAPGARVKDAMTLEAWIAHWQMLAIECPILARAHLFYAGFYGEGERMLVPAPGTGRARKVAGERSSSQVYVLGARGSGRSRVLKAMRLDEDLLASPQMVTSGGGGAQTRSSGEGGATSGAPAAGPDAEPTLPQTCAAFASRRRPEGERRGQSRSGSSPSTSPPSWCRLMSLSVTEVPEDHTESFVEHQASACELAVLVFDPSSMESLDYVIGLQADLPEDVPRLVVACESSYREQDESVVVRAENACQALELSAPLYVNPETREGFDGEGGLRQGLTDPDRPGMVPHAERRRKRRDFHRRLGTAALIAVLGMAVAAAGYYTLSLSATKKSSGRDTRSPGADGMDGTEASGGEDVGGWGMGVRGALRTPVRVVRLAASVATDYWKWWRSGLEAGGLSHAVGLVSSS